MSPWWALAALLYLLVALATAVWMTSENRHQTLREARGTAVIGFGCGLFWPVFWVVTLVAWIVYQVKSWPDGWQRLDDRTVNRFVQIFAVGALQWRTLCGGRNWAIWLVRKRPPPAGDDEGVPDGRS